MTTLPETASYLLHPDDFIRAATLEHITLWDRQLEAIVTGKSSLARIGLQIESAGYVDPYWDGQLTLEIKNLGPYIIMLTPGMLICQIRFALLDAPVGRGYGHAALDSHYVGSTGPVEGRFTPVASSGSPRSEDAPEAP